MNKLKVITYLKNADLHCMTAKETIQQHITHIQLKSLRRFDCWEIESKQPQDELIEKMKLIINSTFYLLNPNKESYFLTAIPKQNHPPHLLVNIESKLQDLNEKLIEKIENKANIMIKGIKKSILWEITIDNKDKNESDLMDEIVLSTSLDKGLLANPYLEKISICNQKEYYQ